MELSLLAAERGALEELVANSRDVRQLKRAQALLAVAAGEGVTAVAQQLQVARNTIYNWIGRLQERAGKIAERLVDAERSGRPDELIAGIREALPKLLAKRPADFGYVHAEWTVDLLQDQLRRRRLDASDKTIRTALHELGYRWKRPRFVLRRRSATWRQAKGGCSAG